jgi:hypothetical protein
MVFYDALWRIMLMKRMVEKELIPFETARLHLDQFHVEVSKEVSSAQYLPEHWRHWNADLVQYYKSEFAFYTDTDKPVPGAYEPLFNAVLNMTGTSRDGTILEIAARFFTRYCSILELFAAPDPLRFMTNWTFNRELILCQADLLYEKVKLVPPMSAPLGSNNF